MWSETLIMLRKEKKKRLAVSQFTDMRPALNEIWALQQKLLI